MNAMVKYKTYIHYRHSRCYKSVNTTQLKMISSLEALEAIQIHRHKPILNHRTKVLRYNRNTMWSICKACVELLTYNN